MGAVFWERTKGFPGAISHGDFHRGNILLAKEAKHPLNVLDFDGAAYSIPAYDTAVMCGCTDYFSFRPGGYTETANAFKEYLAGYQGIAGALSAAEKEGLFYLKGAIWEIHGLDCVTLSFIEGQLAWLKARLAQCEKSG